jgi:FdhD protein
VTGVSDQPLRAPTSRVRIVAITGHTTTRRSDVLATEEPLEIRVAGPNQPATRVAVTMRTPGHDFDLAAGFLFTEALIDTPRAIERIRYCDDVDREEQHYNVLTVTLRHAFDPSLLVRNFYVTSSCGVCGKASIDQIEVTCTPITTSLEVSSETLLRLPDELGPAQRGFALTGGLHATGIADARGRIRTVREDVGRHNAMDKAIGAELSAGRLPLADTIAIVSGRASFELVQKAARASIPVLAAVGAPSSLAVSAAQRLGITLCGFVRNDRLNVYTHPQRVVVATPAAS